jgi:hypothetical protein
LSKPKTHFEQVPMKIVTEWTNRRLGGSSKVYAAARAVAGGQPLSKVTKKVLKWGAVFVLGVGYDMSLTKFLEWSPQTLWTSLPVWSFLFVSLVYWQNGKTRGAPATRWRSSVRVSAWSRGERSRPACGHSVSDG